jgi:putative hydrolase of the HAD superfamily
MFHLLVDADDTLWENLVVFQQVEADFLAWIAHPEGEEEGRRVLDDIQGLLIASHGYGTNTFVRSLQETYRHIARCEPTEEDIARIEALTARLRWTELQILDGVAETLHELSARHDLLMLTKGDHDEQRHKIAISGLEPLFRRTIVVPEKDEQTYRAVVSDEGLRADDTWMIGNSPRSDILPAVAAGLRAVYVPHAVTWFREAGDVPAHERILVLDSFASLLRHF